MRTDGKHKLNTHLYALKSARHKTPEVKQRSEFNSVTHTLRRLRRQAPAESNLVNIQIQPMHPVISVPLESISPSALAIDALQENRGRQAAQTKPVGTKLTKDQQTANQPTEHGTVETKPNETNLTKDQQSPNQSSENGMVETKPVGTKLTGTVALQGIYLTLNYTHSSLDLSRSWMIWPHQN